MKRKSPKAPIPWLRVRVQSSGRTFFYFEIPDGSRKEVPLGSDRSVALAHREQLLFARYSNQPKMQNELASLLELYAETALPTRQGPRANGDRKAILQLKKFAANFEGPTESMSTEATRQLYSKWRGARFAMLAHEEFTLLQQIEKWVLKLRSEVR